MKTPEAEAYLKQLRQNYVEMGKSIREMNDVLCDQHRDWYQSAKRPNPETTGYVYFITELGSGDFFDWILGGERMRFKVGVSKNPLKRIKQLRTGNPRALTLRHTILSHNAKKLERKIHKDLCEFNEQGEWFQDDSHTAINIFGEEVFKGSCPYYLRGKEKAILDASIASHYFYETIDLAEDHKTKEYISLKRRFDRAYETIKQIIKQCNCSDKLSA
ncbi:MAG: GIY-YIG nuclease family protein [Leptolyngbya sp. SIOISBB]|nr:GIY-YIG nuclease family protein [Leptolyngbya sp. SIOISBB]